MKHLWEVKVDKYNGIPDSYTFNVVAENMHEAIRRAEQQAGRDSGYRRSFKAVRAERSEIRVI